ncbi:MAG: hypothetical protein WC586_01360 [Methanoregula sp.]
MNPANPPGEKKPLFARPGKKMLIAIVIILAFVIIGSIALVVLPGQPASRGTTPAFNSAVPQPVQQTVQKSTVNALPSQVDFVIDAGPQEKCGLTCRKLTPTLYNTGTQTAHNVCINVVLYNSGGELIALNGASSLRKCIGDLRADESKSEQITIDADCGFLATKCIRQTLILKTEATSDETTVRFPDSTIAT